ncbi:myeloid leukemia factor [Zerene cesonia]|uniref:myeloid leukemia factor n=1 Tax=Zerene cesonia TaxID=33412 RepID=UPI0018E58C2B|nr:myeloid leukemia factor [Zerene cesonia]
MSLFGSLMADVEDDPFFGSHMRHMRQMSNMMNSLFSDPFGMLGEGPLSIMGPRHGSALMPFMPQMPSLNRLFAADLSDGNMGPGTSFSSSTVVMSSGPNGKPQVYSSSSSTKIGPNGVKETRKTLQDSRTGVKKMSIGHHIGERAHVIEREQNVYSGDAEERQEFIKSSTSAPLAVAAGVARAPSRRVRTRSTTRTRTRTRTRRATSRASRCPRRPPPPRTRDATGPPRAARCAPPPARSPLPPVPDIGGGVTTNVMSGVREVYGSSHPQRHRHRHHKAHRHSPAEN